MAILFILFSVFIAIIKTYLIAKNMLRFIAFICFLIFINNSFAQTPEEKIKSIIQGKDATVGVFVMFDDGKTLSINNEHHYPTMSVYKFHLALAVLNDLNKNKRSLDTEIFIQKSDLLPNTHSPLRDNHPEGNFNISIGELLKYTVSQSDNNGCDILFRYLGGTGAVDQYIKNLGIKDVSIAATEEQMNDRAENQYLNWTTPSSAVQVLNTFLTTKLFSNEYKEFLEKTLIETSTGSNKLKAQLPANVVIGHKTGNSSRTANGLKVADNDLGFIRLPDGRQYLIAVFVMDSKEDDKTNAAIIAAISKTVYEYFISK